MTPRIALLTWGGINAFIEIMASRGTCVWEKDMKNFGRGLGGSFRGIPRIRREVSDW